MLCELEDYFCRFLPYVLSLSTPLASLKLHGHCLVSTGGQYASEVDDALSAPSGWVDTTLSESGQIVWYDRRLKEMAVTPSEASQSCYGPHY